MNGPKPATDLPRVTLVVPNFNYGHYIGLTLQSILDQAYPNLELLVMDGGSTDNSVEVIKRFEKHLAYWQSRPDGGQVAGINAALARTTGSWFNWINSDDVLLPGSLEALAQVIALAPDARWVTGARLHLDAAGHPCDVCTPWRSDPVSLLLGNPFFVQDATFIQTEFLRAAGGVPGGFQNIFDTVLYARLLARARPVLTTAVFSAMRWHNANKSAARELGAQESLAWNNPSARWQQLLARGLRTRVHRAARGAMLAAAASGAFPGAGPEDWAVVAFDHNLARFKRATLAETVFGANPA